MKSHKSNPDLNMLNTIAAYSIVNKPQATNNLFIKENIKDKEVK